MANQKIEWSLENHSVCKHRCAETNLFRMFWVVSLIAFWDISRHGDDLCKTYDLHLLRPNVYTCQTIEIEKQATH